MNKLRSSTLGLILAASIAAGCAGDRMFAVAEPGAGVMTDWYEHRTLYTFANDPTNPPSSACVRVLRMAMATLPGVARGAR